MHGILSVDKTKCESDFAISSGQIHNITHLFFRYDDTYHLTVQFTDGKTMEKRSTTVARRVDSYFDENGIFCFDLYKPFIDKLRLDLSSEKKKA